jgi:hypothetical protein
MKKKKDPITISQLANDFMYLSYNVLPRRLEFLKELENEPGMPKPIKQELVGRQKELISEVKKDIKKKMQDYISHTIN